MALSIITIQDRDFDLDVLKTLFTEYGNFVGVNMEFQNFEDELESLPGRYHPEKNGQLYLAKWDNTFVGCTGFYQLKPGICEIKRLYVKPSFQGKKIGKTLLLKVIQDVQELGYKTLYLDSLKRLEAARNLYIKLGFKEIEPYNENPYPDVYYMALDLTKWNPENITTTKERGPKPVKDPV